MAVRGVNDEAHGEAARQQWNADDYAHNARFVADLGAPLLDWLAPQAGEHVLDLGCGDGALTEKIAAAGATVTGVDASPEMVEAARQRGVDAQLVDGYGLAFDAEFDAVFCNAALHWMKHNPDAVITGVFRALKPGGRFVAEMGAQGNCQQVRDAVHATLAARGVEARAFDPWYFPAPEAYAEKLNAAGFTVERIERFERPTPLPGDVIGWLQTFGQSFLAQWPEHERDGLFAEVRDRLAPRLLHGGRWVLDYVRLRFAACRTG